MTQEYYAVQICGLTRNLPMFEVAPKVRIAIFNMLGDTPVVEAAADEVKSVVRSVGRAECLARLRPFGSLC